MWPATGSTGSSRRGSAPARARPDQAPPEPGELLGGGDVAAPRTSAESPLGPPRRRRRCGHAGRAPAAQPAVEHRHVLVAEMPQQPPEPGGAALAGLVVGDHARAGADSRSPGGRGRTSRASGSGCLPPVARRRREVARPRRGTQRPGCGPLASATRPRPGRRARSGSRPPRAPARRGAPAASRRRRSVRSSLAVAFHGCARWCSRLRASRSSRSTCPTPSRARARSCSRCTPARSAAPTCTSSTASSTAQAPARARATRSSARVVGGRRALRGRRAGRRARGSAGRTATAATAAPGRENLCDSARFTGYDLDGGYAERAVADERFCFPLPEGYPDLQAAPLLCAGLIGYRALRLAGDAERLGIYGFGAAAHIVCQVARPPGPRVFAFTRAGDSAAQAFALRARRGVGRRLATARRPTRSTRRSSSRPSARWSRPRCAPRPRAARWSAAGST